MNPLDRLQELLDERGVKYKHRKFSDLVTIEYVRWKGIGGLEFSAICSQSDPEKLYVNDAIVSPEDAVKATLGDADTCVMRMDDECDEYPQGRWWLCEGCGQRFLYERGFEPHYCPECGRTRRQDQ